MSCKLRPEVELQPRKHRPLPIYDSMHRYRRTPRPFPVVPAALIVLGLSLAARIVL